MKKLSSFVLALVLVFGMLSCVDTSSPAASPSYSTTSAGQGELSPCAPHKDSDDNGSCDSCGTSVVVMIDFYTINDLHGKLSDSEVQPGVDELTTYLERAKQSDDHVIVMANGDMWQGTSESNLTRGQMMTEWLNEIGAVSMTLGNHEFDWSREYIYSNLETAEFPFLAINIYDKTTRARADFATPSIVVERGGAKIGIIGAIGDCHSSISQDKVADVEFKVGSALVSLVKAESDRLRAEGCDYIVFAVHDGVERSGEGYVADSAMSHYYSSVLSDGYIDLVFESHTHQDYVLRDTKGVYHIQGGGDNTAISHVEIKLNFANDKSEVTEIETVNADVYDDCASDPIVGELKEKYKDEIAKGDEKLGSINRNIYSSELCQLSMDLYLEKGLAKWGDRYDIVLSGGYVGTRDPDMLYAGEVTYADIYSVFPFDNELYLCAISGRNLKNKFINSTHSSYYITMTDYGSSLTVNDNDTYYIITDAYSAFYPSNQLTRIEAYGEELFARDMLAEYIKEGGFGGTKLPEGTKLTPIPEIISKVNSLGQNVETSEKYTVIGTIIDEPQATYGNCTIVDAQGNTIYLYGLYGTDGVRYDSMAVKPKKGDTVVVSGAALLYADTANPGEPKPELKDCTVEKVFATKDISAALEAGGALADNASTTEVFYIFGKVADVPNATYGNLTVVDESGDELYVYGVYDFKGYVRYDSMTVKPVQGDTVIIRGTVKKYVRAGQEPIIEIERGYLVAFCSEDSGSLYYM